jgi:hypothetical protein
MRETRNKKSFAGFPGLHAAWVEGIFRIWHYQLVLIIHMGFPLQYHG